MSMIDWLIAMQRLVEWTLFELPSTLYEEMQKSTQEWLIFDRGAGVVAGLSMKPSVLPKKPSVLPIA